MYWSLPAGEIQVDFAACVGGRCVRCMSMSWEEASAFRPDKLLFPVAARGKRKAVSYSGGVAWDALVQEAQDCCKPKIAVSPCVECGHTDAGCCYKQLWGTASTVHPSSGNLCTVVVAQVVDCGQRWREREKVCSVLKRESEHVYDDHTKTRPL